MINLGTVSLETKAVKVGPGIEPLNGGFVKT